MAGNGPAPKPASTRARRNKTSTAATIKADASIVAPELPERDDWHPMVLQWWRDLWASPMAPEYDDADRHGLFELALLRNDFWSAETASARKEAASEIRLQDQRFGLSPIDRRRLQWEIERTDEAQEKGQRRRTKAAERSGEAQGGGKDPRGVLRAV
jgi:hypothetical protein